MAPRSGGGYAIAVDATTYLDEVLFTSSTGESPVSTELGFYSKQYWIGPAVADPDGYVVVGIHDKDISMTLLDSAGDETDEKLWSGDSAVERGDTGHYAASTPNGGYLIVGEAAMKENAFYAANDVILIKTDDAGNTEWVETHGTDEVIESGYAAIAITDENFVVLARREQGDSRIWLFKVGKNHPPVADLSVSNVIATQNALLSFDGSDSSDREGEVVYEWDFGDGSTTTGFAVQHGFSTAGAHRVTMTAVDEEGAEDIAMVTIHALGIEVWEDPEFLVNESSQTDDPGGDSTTYPTLGAPVYLDWENTLGMHISGTSSGSTNRTFRMTFEEVLSPDFQLYTLPDWTSVPFTLIDEHTIEVTLHTPSGEAELNFVFTGMLHLWTLTRLNQAADSRVAFTVLTRLGIEY